MPTELDRQKVKAELERLVHLAEKMSATNSVNRQVLFQLAKSPVNNLLSAGPEIGQDSKNWKQSLAEVAQLLLSLRNAEEASILADNSEAGGDCPVCRSFLKKKSGPDSQNLTETKANVGKSNWYFYCPECSEAIRQMVEQIKSSL